MQGSPLKENIRLRFITCGINVFTYHLSDVEKENRAYAVRFYLYPLYKKLETIRGNQAMFFLVGCILAFRPTLERFGRIFC